MTIQKFTAALKSLDVDSGGGHLLDRFYSTDLPYMAISRQDLRQYYILTQHVLNEEEQAFFETIEAHPEIDYWLVYLD